ncbi:MAG TPA: tRNA (adenosine(37)-N6)-threonylcarbamoyltransferase complex dimerization subunit type 1 TsaB [Haloplasmataceae bacterium]
MKRLLIDTSTQALILILANDQDVIDYLFENIERDHSTRLMPCIESIFVKNNVSVKDINEILVSYGPGSYTGIRIGVVVAKALCYALNIPLKYISTLRLMSASLKNKAKYIVPMIDARRGNVFASLYRVENNELINIISDDLYPYEKLLSDIKKYTQNDDIYFVSNKFPDYVIKDEKLHYELLIDHFDPQLLIQEKFINVDNLHFFVPNYKRLTEAEMNLK